MVEVTHLLDTHAVAWAYVDSKSLGREARAVVERAGSRTLAISDFTLLELAMLIRRGRLKCLLPLSEFLARVESDYVVFPLRAAEASLDMPLAQADPFDRVIVATALCRKLPLLTKDRRIAEAGIVSVVW